MENFSHNTAYASGSREPRSSRAATVRLSSVRRAGTAPAGYGSAVAGAADRTTVLRGDAGERSATGRHAAAPRREQTGHRTTGRMASRSAARPQRGKQVQRPRATAGMGASAPKKESVLGKFAAGAAAMGSKLTSAQPAVSAAMGAPAGGTVAVAAPDRNGRRRSSNFMHYANDNRVVRAVYEFTHGATKPLFIGIVLVAVLMGLYFPVRDLYVAKRTGDILAQQVAIRKKYNDSLQKDVDKLLSEQGIKDTATDKLGLVMPGEKKIDVVGLDDDSSSSSKRDSSQSTKSTEVEAAEKKVAEDAPWYVHALDTVFGFKGVEGQEVSSTGK